MMRTPHPRKRARRAVLDGGRNVLTVSGLTKRFSASNSLLDRIPFKTTRRVVHAAEDVSFTIERGTTLALVGESGCGKSTIARCIAGILSPTSGTIDFMGFDMAKAHAGRAARLHRRHLQMIFQDPYASLDPRWRVGRIIAEPIITHRLIESRAKVDARVEE